MKRRSDVVLRDILNAIMLVEEELAGHTQEPFAKGLFVQRGTERSLEIISEAARHLPDRLLDMRPEICWIDVRSIGNRIRHEY